MVNEVVSANLNGTITLSSNADTYFLLPGITHHDTASTLTVNNDASNVNVTILGSLVATIGTGLNGSNSGGNLDVAIGAAGGIYASGIGVLLGNDANGSSIANDGTVLGAGGISSTSSLDILNNGQITGTSIAAINIRNGAFITNTGSIQSEDIGILLTATTGEQDRPFVVLNSGTITGDTGIELGGEDIEFINNSGSIIGETYSIDAESVTGVVEVINTGAILGNVKLSDNDDFFFGASGTVQGIIDTGEGNDFIQSGRSDDTIRGGLGDDEIFGGDGNDRLFGGVGDNILHGEDGDDDVFAQADDTTDGGAGNDTLYLDDAVDVFNIGTGTMVSNSGLTISQHTNYEALTLEANLGHFIGTNGNDTLDGFAVLKFNTFDGDDSISASFVERGFTGAGSDFVNISVRGELINTGSGDDIVFGGSDIDAIFGGNDDDHLSGNAGNDLIRGNNGNDILSGGIGDDDLNGQDGDDVVDGQDGDDLLLGGAGDDDVSGGEDDDNMFGEDGNDLMYGGAGDDRLRGGTGEDVFVFDQSSDIDRILDWEDGVDQINLTSYFFVNEAAALSFFFQQGANVRFINGDDQLIISNATLVDVTADDLIL